MAAASPPSSSAPQRVKPKPTSHLSFSAAAIQPETRTVKYSVRYKRVFKTLCVLFLKCLLMLLLTYNQGRRLATLLRKLGVNLLFLKTTRQ